MFLMFSLLDVSFMNVALYIYRTGIYMCLNIAKMLSHMYKYPNRVNNPERGGFDKTDITNLIIISLHKQS